MLHHVKISGENAGLHLLLHYQGERSEQELIRLAAQRGVKIYGMSDAYIGNLPESRKPTLILGYAGLSEERIEEGIRRLSDCI